MHVASCAHCSKCLTAEIECQCGHGCGVSYCGQECADADYETHLAEGECTIGASINLPYDRKKKLIEDIKANPGVARVRYYAYVARADGASRLVRARVTASMKALEEAITNVLGPSSAPIEKKASTSPRSRRRTSRWSLSANDIAELYYVSRRIKSFLELGDAAFVKRSKSKTTQADVLRELRLAYARTKDADALRGIVLSKNMDIASKLNALYAMDAFVEERMKQYIEQKHADEIEAHENMEDLYMAQEYLHKEAIK